MSNSGEVFEERPGHVPVRARGLGLGSQQDAAELDLPEPLADLPDDLGGRDAAREPIVRANRGVPSKDLFADPGESDRPLRPRVEAAARQGDVPDAADRRAREASRTQPRPVATPVVDLLFGREGHGRIPLAAVTGTNGKTTTVLLISHLLRTVGRSVGSTTTDGIKIATHTVMQGDYAGPEGGGVVLQDPTVDVAVLEVARGGILRRGLCYDRADVAVVLNVGEDHLGLENIDDLDQLAEVKRVVADAVHPETSRIVLNADDPRVLAMKADARAPVVLFSLDRDSEAVQRHLSEGGTIFTVEDASLVLREGAAPSTPIVKVFEVPIALGGKALYNVSNALAAAAAAHALLGLRIEDLKTGLSTFNPSIGQCPGRLNIIEVAGVDYLIDYAHNVPAFLALKQVVASLCENRPKRHRRIGVVSGTGNRLEQDIRRLGETAASIYSDLIIKDSDPRDRPLGETAEIMKSGALGAGFPGKRLRVILDEQESDRSGVRRGSPGRLRCDPARRYRGDDPAAVGAQGREGKPRPFPMNPGRVTTNIQYPISTSP